MCDCSEESPRSRPATLKEKQPSGRNSNSTKTSPRPDPLALAFEPAGISPWRRNLSQIVVRGTVNFCGVLARRWLLILNSVNFLFVALAFGVPLLEGADWKWLSTPLFGFCHVLCVQAPAHSFYIDGHQMAFCQRCLAIYAMFGLLGLLFQLVRHKLKPPKFWQFGLFCLPMAVDALTQMFGWRESTPELRLLTGGLFGFACVWYIYPQLEAWMRALMRWVNRNKLANSEFI